MTSPNLMLVDECLMSTPGTTLDPLPLGSSTPSADGWLELGGRTKEYWMSLEY